MGRQHENKISHKLFWDKKLKLETRIYKKRSQSCLFFKKRLPFCMGKSGDDLKVEGKNYFAKIYPWCAIKRDA